MPDRCPSWSQGAAVASLADMQVVHISALQPVSEPQKRELVDVPPSIVKSAVTYALLRANPALTRLLGCPVVIPWTCIAIRLSGAHVHVHCRTCKSRIRLISINHYTTVQWDSGRDSLAGKGSLIHTNFDTS